MWSPQSQLIHDRQQYLVREADFRYLMERSGARGRDGWRTRTRRWFWPRPAAAVPRPA